MVQSFFVILSRKNNGHFSKKTAEEEGDVGVPVSRGTKRKRGAVKSLRGVEGAVGQIQADLDTILESLPGSSKSRRTTAPRGPRKGRKGKRKPTLKSSLLKSLRADRKRLKDQLRDIERDINSLVCHKKKKTE